MPEVKHTVTKSRAARLTRLDVCGMPVVGPKSTLVDRGFVRAENAFDIEDGEVFQASNSWGERCVNERDDPRYNGTEVTTDFCQVSHDAHELTLGARALAAEAADTFTTIGATVGHAIGENTVPGAWALELWTRVPGACTTGGTQVWAYTVWPWLYAGKPGNRTYERSPQNWQIVAQGKGAAAADLLADFYEADLPAIAAGDIWLTRLTLVQPPAETDGLIALAAI